ncbi:MAG: hypothetical protein AAB553_01585 [Patescibacteria group bacterium]
MINILGIGQKDDQILLYYAYTKSGKTFCKVVSSTDGYQFNGQTKYVIATDEKNREEKNYDWYKARIAKQKDTYFLTYKTLSKTAPNLHGAVSSDFLRWTKSGRIESLKEVGTVIPDFKDKNRYVMYFGEQTIKLAYSGDLKNWKVDETPLLEPRVGTFEEDSNLEVAGVFQAYDNILLPYYSKRQEKGKYCYEVGACLFNRKNPKEIIWRSEKPLWSTPRDLHHESLKPLGIAMFKEQLILYWTLHETTVFAVSCPIPGKHAQATDKQFNVVLNRYANNPIITPNPKNKWESRATFNSAALYEDGKVHFLYRALGASDISVLGYASSCDGVTIDERSDLPAYVPREDFELPQNLGDHQAIIDPYISGGGYGGIEDPRITRIEDTIYLTYVAHNGASPPRATISSIKVEDFLKQRWDKWSKAKLISAPGIVNKSAVIFPEKVQGKYVIFHRVYPNILVDYVDDLNFNNYLQGQYFIPPRKTHWDSKKLSAGAPPIRTKDGWLMIYHSVGYQDPSRYKIGAMLLDLENPTKVLYRSNKPIISPDAPYENEGKAGVVYPCGAAVVGDTLHVYYGGGDTVLCAASQNLNTFLEQMKYNQEPKLQKIQSPMLN